MFNPNPDVTTLAISPASTCLVIDNALEAPDRWVERACLHADAFEALPGNAYPGVELHMPDGVTAAIDALLQAPMRRALGAGETLSSYSRLALVTKTPPQLSARQWLCHRDRMGSAPNQIALACVLYLFTDPRLGGTSFYRAQQSEAQTAALIQDSDVLSDAAFGAKYGLSPGFITASNPYFAQTLVVPAKFNRMIFYSGELFHSSHITAPQLLHPDPARGRLTLNGFFTCLRA
jgi:hypothetical protein